MRNFIKKNTIWDLNNGDKILLNNDDKILYNLLCKKLLVKDFHSNWVSVCTILEDNYGNYYYGYNTYFYVTDFLHWYKFNQAETDLLIIKEII